MTVKTPTETVEQTVCRLRASRDDWRLKFENREEIFTGRLRFHWACAATVILVAAIGGYSVGSARASSIGPLAAMRSGEAQPAQADCPEEMLASVWFNGCSGTVISAGPEVARIISCGHCFGEVGAQYTVYFCDGSEAPVRCIRRDEAHELSELIVNSKYVLGVCPVPEDETPHGTYTICGYPAGVGPTWHELIPSPAIATAEGKWRWQFSHKDNGRAWYGSSGCGVFKEGLLVGVQSHIVEDGGAGKTFNCSSHRDLLNFVRTSQRSDCGNGTCKFSTRNERRESAPPGPGQAASQVAQKQNSLGFVPQPNRPLYNGRGKQPKDLNTAKKKAVEIDKLRKAEPEQQIEQPAPQPPAIDLSSVHSHLDAIQAKLNAVHQDVADNAASPQPPGPLAFPNSDKLTGDIVAGVRRELPIIMSQHLGPVEDRLKAEIAGHGLDPTKLVTDLKGAIVPELPAIGKQAAEDALPGLKVGLLSHLSAILPGLVTAAAPSLLGPVGIPVSAGLLGFGLLHFLSARRQSKSADSQAISMVGAVHNVAGALGTHTTTINGQTDLLANLIGVVKSLVAPVASVAAGQTAAGAPSPAPASDPTLQKILDAVSKLQNSPQPSTPAQAGASSAPATLERTTVTQVINDEWRTAYSQAKQALLLKEGIPSINTLRLFESLLNQYLSGLKITPVK